MSELLNCPFCGGEAREYKQRFSFYGEAVDMACCDKCGFSLVKSVWNTRTPMANIVEKLEELKKDNTNGCEKVNQELCNSYLDCGLCLIDRIINIVKQEINNGLK